MKLKMYLLVRLENGANKVIDEKAALNIQEAIQLFNSYWPFTLNDNGYLKVGNVTYCIAEPFNQ